MKVLLFVALFLIVVVECKIITKQKVLKNHKASLTQSRRVRQTDQCGDPYAGYRDCPPCPPERNEILKEIGQSQQPDDKFKDSPESSMWYYIFPGTTIGVRYDGLLLYYSKDFNEKLEFTDVCYFVLPSEEKKCPSSPNKLINLSDEELKYHHLPIAWGYHFMSSDATAIKGTYSQLPDDYNNDRIQSVYHFLIERFKSDPDAFLCVPSTYGWWVDDKTYWAEMAKANKQETDAADATIARIDTALTVVRFVRSQAEDLLMTVDGYVTGGIAASVVIFVDRMIELGLSPGAITHVFENPPGEKETNANLEALEDAFAAVVSKFVEKYMPEKGTDMGDNIIKALVKSTIDFMFHVPGNKAPIQEQLEGLLFSICVNYVETTFEPTADPTENKFSKEVFMAAWKKGDLSELLRTTPVRAVEIQKIFDIIGALGQKIIHWINGKD